jgi:NAD(P)H-hydrate epimerase
MQFVKVEDLPKLPARDRDGHKGDYGRILVVGGSRRMIGAPALAANGALRGGAGLVTVASPATVQLAVAMLCQCATSAGLACRKTGKQELSPDAVGRFRALAELCDVLAVGPGLAVGQGQEMLIRSALELQKPLVLDADGLNNLANIDNWPKLRQCPLVLTPHPGELARLMDTTSSDIQADRQDSAMGAIEAWLGRSQTSRPMVLVLKGAETIVTDGRRVYINETGNPGMATGGSGDVLTGLVAALAGQGLELFAAAALATYAHGLAGDLAAQAGTEQSTIASDLLEYLPRAMREIVQ